MNPEVSVELPALKQMLPCLAFLRSGPPDLKLFHSFTLPCRWVPGDPQGLALQGRLFPFGLVFLPLMCLRYHLILSILQYSSRGVEEEMP